MAFLWKREQDENELSWAARRVLEGVRRGLSDDQAAAEANIDEDELRAWKRDPHFRSAIRRARREGPREVHLWFFDGPDTDGIPPPSASTREIERRGWRRLDES